MNNDNDKHKFNKKENDGSWSDLKDFEWHKQQASPHWAVVPTNKWPQELLLQNVLKQNTLKTL